VKIGWQRAGNGVAAAVRKFGLQDTRSAGTKENSNAPTAVFCDNRLDRIGKPILFQRELQQTVVAAVKRLQVSPDHDIVNTRHLADIGIEIDRVEITGRQAALALTYGLQRTGKPATDTAGCREMREV